MGFVNQSDGIFMKQLIPIVLAFALLISAANADGLPGVGTTKAFPPAMQSGARVNASMWQWSDNAAERREVLKLQNGLKIPFQSLPKSGMHFKFVIPVAHDAVRCTLRSTDSFDQAAWGPEKVERAGSATHLYRAYPEQFFYPPQVGKYYLSVEATDNGKSVAKSVILFEIVDARAVPRDTHYLDGKKDNKGNAITTSKPVILPALNETPILRDNDYAFEPQHAYNVINFERFPPFSLPKRFIGIWNSRRFSDEDKFGGPLNRGFTSLAVIKPEQDNLPINQRAWFHTPDHQVNFINQWFKEDPQKYADLKSYADYRSAFVSPENAYKLGWATYDSWGAGNYAPYDAGLYGWDEEQMWPTIATKMLKEHPELLPERLRKLREGDPNVEKPETIAILSDEYSKAWADFIGNTYRGARDAAAARGRVLKVWHYGSKPPGNYIYLGRDDANINPATGKPTAEEGGALSSWFKSGDKIDFAASEYARQIDYFHQDFYYHVLFPQHLSMYEKGADGKYVLDEKGRRKIRRDVFEETNYTDPVKIGYEDCEAAPVFLKAFLAKGENALFWLNGGKNYKQRGTAVTNKQLIPALRPGNQETWGDTAQFGSRPVSPYMAEAASIYTYMMGLEGLYLWDSRLYSGPAGFGADGDTKQAETLGDMEFIIKGMHRVSQLNSLFEGDYYFVRPIRHYDTWNRDHPLIRGILNGRYLALAMTNPYLDIGESQNVELCYGAPFEGTKKPVWAGKVALQPRKTHLFQCKLPALPVGQKYDPDKLYFRYTCADGNFRQTFTLTGHYNP